MKPITEIKWMENRWPLIEAGMSRKDCHRWFERVYPGRPLAKSACIGCPFHNDLEWKTMKADDPESWADAIYMDEQIRHKGRSGDLQYMHRSKIPLSEVDFRTAEEKGQLNLFNNECLGMCGT